MQNLPETTTAQAEFIPYKQAEHTSKKLVSSWKPKNIAKNIVVSPPATKKDPALNLAMMFAGNIALLILVPSKLTQPKILCAFLTAEKKFTRMTKESLKPP